MRINCYGENAEEHRILCRTPHEPSETKRIGGKTYHRYGSGSKCAIQRLCVNAEGMVELRWAYGDWSRAESLDYALELDETLEVEA